MLQTNTCKWGREGKSGHLLIGCTVAMPTGHSLQHAAEETSIAVRLILRTAGHSVNDSREHLQRDPMIQMTRVKKLHSARIVPDGQSFDAQFGKKKKKKKMVLIVRKLLNIPIQL